MRNAAAVQRFWRNPCRTLEREDEASTSWPVGVRSVRAAYDVKLAGFATALEDRRPVFSRSRTWSTFWMGGTEVSRRPPRRTEAKILFRIFRESSLQESSMIPIILMLRRIKHVIQNQRLFRIFQEESLQENFVTPTILLLRRIKLERDPFKKGSFAMKEWRYRDLRKLATTLGRHSDPVNFTKDDNIFFNHGRFMKDHKSTSECKSHSLLLYKSIRIKTHEIKEATRVKLNHE
ncbi:hypothetical protein V1477_015006, partial [Vespula maculifrons]